MKHPLTYFYHTKHTGKQICLIHLNTALTALPIAGASWVALLASREFSLVEIGFAESVFHVASLLFEVPSGVFADVFGRRRSMLASQLMMAASAFLMLTSSDLPGVLLSMVCSALGYNFASGAREALAYETLKAAGEEAEYDRFSSTDNLVYRICQTAATLCAGLALFMGYRKAYLLDVLMGISCFVLTLGLEEMAEGQCAEPAAGSSEEKRRGRWSESLDCVVRSLAFIRGNGKLLGLILFNAFVGAAATLIGFFQQARLPQCGLRESLLGPALFFIGLGGVAGAWLVMRLRDWSFRRVCAVSLAAVTLCLLGFFSGLPWLMILCGFVSAMADDFLQIRSDVKLNERIPSGQRATLLSVSSLCFSLVMAVLSPALGMLLSQ